MTERTPASQEKAYAEEGLALLCAGDERGVTWFIAYYGKWIYGKAVRILKNPDDAEDACQDIFIKVFRKIGQWDPLKGSFRQWLNRLVLNALFDAYRKTHRHPRSLQEHILVDSVMSAWDESFSREYLVDALERLPCDKPLPDVQAELRETQQVIRETLERVCAKHPLQRQAWWRHYVHEDSIPDIATSLGQNLSTVKVWLFRVNRRLRPQLEKRGITALSQDIR